MPKTASLRNAVPRFEGADAPKRITPPAPAAISGVTEDTSVSSTGTTTVCSARRCVVQVASMLAVEQAIVVVVAGSVVVVVGVLVVVVGVLVVELAGAVVVVVVVGGTLVVLEEVAGPPHPDTNEAANTLAITGAARAKRRHPRRSAKRDNGSARPSSGWLEAFEVDCDRLLGGPGNNDDRLLV